MPGEAVYERWQTRGINNAWVLGFCDLICRLLPRQALYAVGDDLVERYYDSHPDVDRTVEANLRGAFPEKERVEIRALALATGRSYARGVIDYLRAHRDPPRVLVEPEVEARLRGVGKGKILVTAHMGNWEVGGFYLGRLLGPHWILAFPERDPGVDRIRREKRESSGLKTLHAGEGLGGLFEVRKILEEGGTAIVLVDRAIGKDGTEVLFRKRRARFLKSPALLSALAGVPIVPVALMAEGGGVYRAWAGDPSLAVAGDPQGALQPAADFFSAILESYPDQWYNFFPFWEEA